jgi:hypothetical protein
MILPMLLKVQAMLLKVQAMLQPTPRMKIAERPVDATNRLPEMRGDVYDNLDNPRGWTGRRSKTSRQTIT